MRILIAINRRFFYVIFDYGAHFVSVISDLDDDPLYVYYYL